MCSESKFHERSVFGSYIIAKYCPGGGGGTTSSWADVNAGVPQGSIPGSLLFLIYTNNDLADGLSSNVKLFVDDTSLCFVVHNTNTTAKELNYDLVKINRWTYQWKTSFNPDPNKKVQEVIFSRKKERTPSSSRS